MIVINKRKRNHESGRSSYRVPKRPHYPIVAIEEVSTRLSDAQVFTSLDACSEFWQLPLDLKSSKLHTFNPPKGWCRFTRLSFGIAQAPEIF